jgi:hypothetical protein
LPICTLFLTAIDVLKDRGLGKMLQDERVRRRIAWYVWSVLVNMRPTCGPQRAALPHAASALAFTAVGYAQVSSLDERGKSAYPFLGAAREETRRCTIDICSFK